MKEKNGLENKGITIITLVITIIILLILAGVSITILMGNNGLLTRAKEAKKNTINSIEEENTILDGYNENVDEQLASSRDTINDDKWLSYKFENKSNINGLSFFTNPKYYCINMNANIKNIIGLKKGTTYKINVGIRLYNSETANFEYGLYDIKNNEFVASVKSNHIGWKHYNDVITYTASEDVTVKVAMRTNSNIQYINYGYATIYTNENNMSNIYYAQNESIASTLIPSIVSSDGNVEVDNTNKIIKLKMGKAYKIDYNMNVKHNNEWGNFKIINKTTSEELIYNEWCSGDDSIKGSLIYMPEIDSNIQMQFNRQGGTTTAVTDSDIYIKIFEL